LIVPDLNATQGIPAEREIVVVDADAINIEHITPDRG
jgi:hypothetical protein